MPKERDKSPRDVPIARLAAAQHGVVTTEQLLAAGVLASGITERVSAGRLHRIHRGVYAVGHPRLSDKGRWIAAVLASGEAAVLSHGSAARLWEIARHAEPNSVHVTVPGTAGKRKRPGIVLHRSSSLRAGDCTRRDGIPVTKPARTLADLRTVVSAAELAATRREAEFRRLPIDEDPAADRARSDLEQAFAAMCRRHRLPRPAVNAPLDRYEVDFLWSDCRVVVEVDGWESHRSRSAFEEDRARDARLKLLGYDVLRFTWRQLKGDPRNVARTIRSLLRARN